MSETIFDSIDVYSAIVGYDTLPKVFTPSRISFKYDSSLETEEQYQMIVTSLLTNEVISSLPLYWLENYWYTTSNLSDSVVDEMQDSQESKSIFRKVFKKADMNYYILPFLEIWNAYDENGNLYIYFSDVVELRDLQKFKIANSYPILPYKEKDSFVHNVALQSFVKSQMQLNSYKKYKEIMCQIPDCSGIPIEEYPTGETALKDARHSAVYLAHDAKNYN